MQGFAVISKEKYTEGKRKSSFLRYILPPETIKDSIEDIDYTWINVSEENEALKLRQAKKMAGRISKIVVSRDYNINYSKLCYYSLLIRALDYYSVSLGCDLRLGEVVIGDGATYEGMCAFKLLCPIARRILLVTKENKGRLMDIAEKAMIEYGISAAVVEDPIKASERADAVILAADNDDYTQLLTKDRPTLLMRFPKPKQSGRWFDDVGIAYKDMGGLREEAVQGYLSCIGKDRIWNMAEREGFFVDAIMQQGKVVLKR